MHLELFIPQYGGARADGELVPGRSYIRAGIQDFRISNGPSLCKRRILDPFLASCLPIRFDSTITFARHWP